MSDLNASSSRTLNVLLVEDEPDIAAVVEISLGSDPGFIMTTFTTGGEAINHAETTNERYDILLVNIRLPDISGVDLLGLLRTFDCARRAAPVAITALVSETQLAIYDRAQCRAIIAKPFDAAGLGNTLRRIHAGELSGVINAA